MLTKIGLFNFVIVILVYNLSKFTIAIDYKLKSISVLFRHGDVTPEIVPKYPNDPYYNTTLFPAPVGLTNIGMLRAYMLGKYLRKRYNDTVSELHFPDDVETHSTDFEWTVSSSLFVLAGLFPRNNNELRSSPNLTCIMYAPKLNDPVLLPTNCPAYKKEFAEVLQSPEYKKEFSKIIDSMAHLSNFAGLNITTSGQMLGLFNALESEYALNVILPNWTTPEFPEGAIEEAAIFDLKTISYNTKLTKLSGGMFLRKFLNSVKTLKMCKSRHKIFLYSVHDTTISSVLRALKTWKPEMPEYTSAVILELWKKYSNYYVKVVYYKGVLLDAEELTINGCSKYCSLSDFKEILHNVLPNNYDKACFG